MSFESLQRHCFLCDCQFNDVDTFETLFDPCLKGIRGLNISLSDILVEVLGHTISDSAIHSKLVCIHCRNSLLSYKSLQIKSTILKERIFNTFKDTNNRYNREQENNLCETDNISNLLNVEIMEVENNELPLNVSLIKEEVTLKNTSDESSCSYEAACEYEANEYVQPDKTVEEANKIKTFQLEQATDSTSHNDDIRQNESINFKNYINNMKTSTNASVQHEDLKKSLPNQRKRKKSFELDTEKISKTNKYRAVDEYRRNQTSETEALNVSGMFSSLKTLFLDCNQKLLNKMNSMQTTMNALGQQVHKLENVVTNMVAESPQSFKNDHNDEIEKYLPFTDMSKFDEFEQHLKDSAFMQETANYMKTIGGNDSHELVQNILKRFISNQLAQRFNVEGKNKKLHDTNGIDREPKRPIKNTLFLACVFRAARMHRTQVDESVLKSKAVGSWLAGASLRIKRENEKKIKKDTAPTTEGNGSSVETGLSNNSL